MMARIIKYDGNLQATVRQDDSIFCNKILRVLSTEQIVKLPLSNKRFSIIADETKKRLTVYVKKMSLFQREVCKQDFKDIVANLEEERNGDMGQPKYDPSRI